jgi:hypothetical protein
VAGSTSVVVEYYTIDTALDGTTTYTQLDYSGESATYAITEVNTDAEHRLQGVPIVASDGSQKASTVTDLATSTGVDPSAIHTVYRLRTEVQDAYDFYFGYSLNISAAIIHGEFIPELMINPQKRVDYSGGCIFYGGLSLTCEADITVLNAYLRTIGFAVTIDHGADSAVVLVLLNDTGNIDWLDRPLAAGFSVQFFAPAPDDQLLAPIAAVVILPIIAAATAAAIAAAWLFLGQRASEYAGAQFDAFAVTTGAGGNTSPLYDAKGLEVTSALYDERGAHQG